MPSSIAHALTAVAIGTVVLPRERLSRLHLIAAAGAVMLDLDAIGRPFGLGDVGWLGGHRAITHSIPFALTLALFTVLSRWRQQNDLSRGRVLMVLAFAFMSHGLLDTLTSYGEGVMLFAPFSLARISSPWQPISGVAAEVVGIWLPASVLLLLHHRSHRRAAPLE